MNITPWPTNTSSSIVTPSQMKVCDEILQRAPTDAFFWISTNVPTRVSSPIAAAVEVDELRVRDRNLRSQRHVVGNRHRLFCSVPDVGLEAARRARPRRRGACQRGYDNDPRVARRSYPFGHRPPRLLCNVSCAALGQGD